MKERLDLIALTSQRSDMCYRVINGENVYDFRRVIIKVTNPDGSIKRYEIVRSITGREHHIETYTTPKEAYWFDTQRDKRWKWYNDAQFEAKLKKLNREIAKTDYQIQLW
jgi:hypothetical protein